MIDQMQNGILIQKGNVKDLKEALEFLMKEKNQRIEFGKRLEEKVSETFSLTRMIEETKRVYRGS